MCRWWIGYQEISEKQWLRRSSIYTKYVPTNDNWCPSFDGGYVCVQVLWNLKDNYRVYISGGDDTLIAFETNNKEFCLWLYNKIDHFDYSDEKFYIYNKNILYVDRN